RRRRFVTRNAIRLAGLSHKTAEKLLVATLKRQAEAMTRKGIPAAVVERESRNLENAIRAELWRQILLRPGDGVAGACTPNSFGMGDRRKRTDKGRLAPFGPLDKEMMDSPAWRAMSYGARCLYIHLKRRWSFKQRNNGRLFMSQRDAQKEM